MENLVKHLSVISICLATLIACGGGGSTSNNGSGITLSTQASVGKKLFNDENLSSEANQSCASCHDPAFGFADPDVSVSAPVSEGSRSGDFGNRNAPTAAYASQIPEFTRIATQTLDGTNSSFQGGQFLDGRRSTLAEQARDPFLNPVEMNNTDAADVVSKVQAASYADEFRAVFGADAFADTATAYNNIATAIAAFESTSEMNPFTSKFDAVMAGSASFTASEQSGFELFTGDVAKCANCHTVNDPDPAGSLFTDFNYFNIGTPVNTNNPAYVDDNNFRDGGLGDSLALTDPTDQAAEQGKFRTPTLRNIELTAPYMHNGRYETLREVILHYDIVVSSAESGFSLIEDYPEVDANIALELNFNDPNFTPALGLIEQEMIDLENFMLTLTDGYF